MSLRLFEGFGVEIECMLVDAETLAVRPAVDALIHDFLGRYDTDVDLGAIELSNELALHVVEFKTNGPTDSLHGLADRFQEAVREVNRRLEPMGARLMPGGMHPFMDPVAELRLWPHEYNAVYETFDRIFGCTGHGWANLQSTHVNLPFSGDDEFRRLHHAIRLVLPLIPALAASSPVFDGRVGPDLDNRLRAYQSNARRIPSIAGLVVPEPVESRAEYEERILGRIYRDLEPHDPEGTIRHEWANARGAIARFQRDAIEIRLIDAQECAAADLAVAAAVTAAVRHLTDGDIARESAHPTEALAQTLDRTIRDGERAVIEDTAYLHRVGFPDPGGTAGEVWSHLIESTLGEDPDAAEWNDALGTILRDGPLARRLLAALGADMPGEAPDAERMHAVYRRLCDCAAEGRVFEGP